MNVKYERGVGGGGRGIKRGGGRGVTGKPNCGCMISEDGSRKIKKNLVNEKDLKVKQIILHY